MNILAIDDEIGSLHLLEKTLRIVRPSANIHAILGNGNTSEILSFVSSNPPDVVFLDIMMPEIKGTELARAMKNILPTVNIIFVTAYLDYTMDALEMHASGYIHKPITRKQVEAALSNLLYKKEEVPEFFIHTFGKFDVLYYGQPIAFDRSKAKELLAILVDARGEALSRKEILSVLFEENSYSRSNQSYFTKIYRSLKDTLQKYKKDHLLIKGKNSYRFDFQNAPCDLKDFLCNGHGVANNFHGTYMEQYPWADASAGELSSLILEPSLKD